MTHELPLVIFTLAAQLSVGSFVVLGLIHILGARVPATERDRVVDPALYAIGPLLVLGLAASVLHLGSPLRAPNSLLHLGSSWLSLEILLGLGFLVLGAAFAFLQWRKLGPAGLRTVLAAATALVGVGLVWAISQVYSLRTVPAWATWFTPFNFFVTTLLLGALAVGAALIVSARFTEENAALRDRCVQAIACGSLVGIVAKLTVQPVYLGYLSNHPQDAARTSLRIITDTYANALLGANVFLLIGAGLLAVVLYRSSVARRYTTAGRSPVASLPGVALAAFGFVLFAEVLHRMLFYASMAVVGFGGQ